MAMGNIYFLQNQFYFECKFCDQLFTNFQLFQPHFVSHFAQENLAMRNLNHINSQREPLQQNLSRSMFMQTVANRGFQAPQQQLGLMSQPRTVPFSPTMLQNAASPQHGIGGSPLQPNFPGSMSVQGTTGNNIGNRGFQGTNLNNAGSRVPQQLRIGGAPLQPNSPGSTDGNRVFQGTNINNAGSRAQQLAIGGNIVGYIVLQGTNISNVGGASSQSFFTRSMFVQDTSGNSVGYIVFNQGSNVNDVGMRNRLLLVPPQHGIGATSLQQNVASQPLMTSFAAPQIPQGNDAMEVSPIDGTKDYINQLDKSIDDNKFVDSADVNDETLNLELGL